MSTADGIELERLLSHNQVSTRSQIMKLNVGEVDGSLMINMITCLL